MDPTDRKILALLQADATLSIAAIAERVGLSSTPCWNRIRALDAADVIQKRVALLDPEKVNLPVTVFVAIRTSQHNTDWLDNFARRVVDLAEVVEVYRMSGDIDYLLRVVVPDIAGYDAVYKRLIEIADMSDVSSSFAMERIKFTTELPLDYMR